MNGRYQMAGKKSKVHCTIFNRDPNETKYVGRRGATLSVMNDSGVEIAKYKWVQKTFLIYDSFCFKDELNRMAKMKKFGWMQLASDTLGIWEQTETSSRS